MIFSIGFMEKSNFKRIPTLDYGETLNNLPQKNCTGKFMDRDNHLYLWSLKVWDNNSLNK